MSGDAPHPPFLTSPHPFCSQFFWNHWQPLFLSATHSVQPHAGARLISFSDLIEIKGATAAAATKEKEARDAELALLQVHSCCCHDVVFAAVMALAVLWHSCINSPPTPFSPPSAPYPALAQESRCHHPYRL
jgi:hypothetical protein